jgi:agmatinase
MKLHETPFLGQPYASSFEEAGVVVLPVPYEGGVSYGKGAARGPQAILEASTQVEVYDSLLGDEPYRTGIATLAPLTVLDGDSVGMYEAVRSACKALLAEGKFVVLLGGDHSVSVPYCRAFSEHFGAISVVQFDAHADLREEYESSRVSHACTMTRIREITQDTLQVGVRSLSAEEASRIDEEALSVCSVRQLRDNGGYLGKMLPSIPDPVFLTIDVDVFDWSVVWSTGTPEPGGLLWDEALRLFGEVFGRCTVAGFDVVELAPRNGDVNSPFAVARLVNHLIGLRSCRK